MPPWRCSVHIFLWQCALYSPPHDFHCSALWSYVPVIGFDLGSLIDCIYLWQKFPLQETHILYCQWFRDSVRGLLLLFKSQDFFFVNLVLVAVDIWRGYLPHHMFVSVLVSRPVSVFGLQSSPVTSHDEFSTVTFSCKRLCVFAFFGIFVQCIALWPCGSLWQATMTSVWSTTVTTMTTVWSSPTNRDLCQPVTDGLWPLLLRRD